MEKWWRRGWRRLCRGGACDVRVKQRSGERSITSQGHSPGANIHGRIPKEGGMIWGHKAGNWGATLWISLDTLRKKISCTVEVILRFQSIKIYRHKPEGPASCILFKCDLELLLKSTLPSQSSGWEDTEGPGFSEGLQVLWASFRTLMQLSKLSVAPGPHHSTWRVDCF